MIEVEVKAGGHVVGRLDIWCIEGNDDWNSLNKYQATLRWEMARPNSDKSTTIMHRYGDAWPILVQRALRELIGYGSEMSR